MVSRFDITIRWLVGSLAGHTCVVAVDTLEDSSRASCSAWERYWPIIWHRQRYASWLESSLFIWPRVSGFKARRLKGKLCSRTTEEGSCDREERTGLCQTKNQENVDKMKNKGVKERALARKR